MNKILRSGALRRLMWRAGRWMYAYARGDGQNDPRTNGEYWLLECVLRSSTRPQVLLDVGANEGDWTAHALGLSRAPSEVHVHAFEPSLATRTKLLGRFMGNAQVTVHSHAFSEAAGDATFYSNGAGSGTNSLSPISGSLEELVSISTIDLFLEQMGIDAVSMMKIDTEGFDLLVLKGAEQALRNGLIGIIQFEYNWRWLVNHACLRDVFDLISGKPYRLGKLVGGAVEFYDQWHFEMDRFFENNYVLVKSDSILPLRGASIRFDGSNVGMREDPARSEADARA